jgi:hypothetical protein
VEVAEPYCSWKRALWLVLVFSVFFAVLLFLALNNAHAVQSALQRLGLSRDQR